MFEIFESKTIYQKTESSSKSNFVKKHSCEKTSSKVKGNAMQAVEDFILSTSKLYAVQKDAYHKEVKKISRKAHLVHQDFLRPYTRRPSPAVN